MNRPRKELSPAEIKKLYGRSGNRCAFAGCRRELVLEATEADPTKQIGERAHIVGHSDDGPRGDSGFPRDQLDTYENSILLCPACHAQVDAHSNTYTVDSLRTIKADHERWVKSTLAAAMPSVGFPELEVVAKAIASPPSTPTDDFTITAPREKMARNRLTNDVGQLITMGMVRSQEVSAYLQNMSTFDPDLPERLKSGFLTAYQGFRAQNLDDDALFEAMREFAGGGSGDFKRQAAGLAVLVYLFESCEVFEK
ncbi:MAG: HNH endonuclease [Magnetococcales bacterium]|nr:HNH endonuclease [Magnetococcales bacterium]MBF0323031.1 HNH endonuclease [Magnetococcales bacterium]